MHVLFTALVAACTRELREWSMDIHVPIINWLVICWRRYTHRSLCAVHVLVHHCDALFCKINSWHFKICRLLAASVDLARISLRHFVDTTRKCLYNSRWKLPFARHMDPHKPLLLQGLCPLLVVGQCTSVWGNHLDLALWLYSNKWLLLSVCVELSAHYLIFFQCKFARLLWNCDVNSSKPFMTRSVCI